MSKHTPAKIDFTEEILSGFTKSKSIEEPKQEESRYVNQISKKWSMNDKIVRLFEANIEKDQKLRNIYGIILIVMLFIELVALTVIFILVGANILEYSEATLNLFITGGIAEVFVLVKLIVKYLFKDNLTNSLNIILENNNTIKNRFHKRKDKTSDKR